MYLCTRSEVYAFSILRDKRCFKLILVTWNLRNFNDTTRRVSSLASDSCNEICNGHG